MRLPMQMLVRLSLYRRFQILWIIPEAEANLVIPDAIPVDHASLPVFLSDPPGLALPPVKLQVHARHRLIIIEGGQRVAWGCWLVSQMMVVMVVVGGLLGLGEGVMGG